jgi:hypothetical protein
VLGSEQARHVLPLPPLDLEPGAAAASVVAIALAAAIVTGVAVESTVWLRARLQGQQPIRRMAGDVTYWGGCSGAEPSGRIGGFSGASILDSIAVVLPVGIVVVWWRDKAGRQRQRPDVEG